MLTQRLIFFAALLLFPATIMLSQGDIKVADIVFVNGKIWTVDASKPEAEAVAVLCGRILHVGTNDEIRRHVGPGTNVIDLQGKRMLPGFIDNHTHFMTGGFQLLGVDLRDAKTPQEFAERIKRQAERFPVKWLTGGDWDHENWEGAPLPTKDLIDAVAPSTPVFVNRFDGHMALANSFALKLAGVTKDTPDPPGGAIVHDPKTGEPTGILKDEAMGYVYRIIPQSTEAENLLAAKTALEEAKRNGITSIQDVSSPDDFALYQELLKRGELTARFHCRLPISELDQLSRTGVKAHFGNEMLTIGSLKAFADGSLGSSTALFFEPYTQDPSTCGLASDIVIDGRLEKWALAADRAGLQLSIHAIGDSANSLLLDLFEKIVKGNPPWDRRFRIEHAQHIHPTDYQRFAKLGVIASAQPYHAIDDGRWAEKRIGHERCKNTYPFKSFLDNGVKLCFGSDWTVAPISALQGIYAAVTRRTLDGKNPDGWFPEQKISVKQAIECYTINNVYAVFEEGIKGSITEGKLADFVLLSDDILTIDPVKIWDAKVDMTVLGGKIVYERSK
ncbi:MAG: amidohydrolase [Ignavibacteriales bacterium CG07_land_8_20_14_0_80_59_12]|nr:MAG: amidohydrolase [Ignavibacteriales bacterium CG07_land_8_20_14_0_80_59_12]